MAEEFAWDQGWRAALDYLDDLESWEAMGRAGYSRPVPVAPKNPYRTEDDSLPPSGTVIGPNGGVMP